MHIKVSVIIPCYNQAHFLKESVASVLAQTYTNWECIIINDGSTDLTDKIGLSFEEKDSRIKYLKKKNGGLGSARNAGLNVADGNLIQFLDADDILAPEKFSRQLEPLNETNIAENLVLYSNYTYGKNDNINEKISKVKSVVFHSNDYLEELILRWENDFIIPCHCFLLSSDFFLKDLLRFDETIPNHEDLDCWLSIFSKRPQVLFTDEILCRYRQSVNSMSTNMRLMGEGFLQVLDKHLKMPEYSLKVKKLFIAKKLSVLQSYRRFDLMTLKEKFNSLPVIREYYFNRLLDKFRRRP